tara:strand:- start:233 stop:538 length:306 start_codon:yes stop_codon:yes gene_type:complete
MSKSIKFSEEEIKQLQSLQNSYQQITFSMGQISLSKVSLDNREKAVLQALDNVRKEEAELAKSLTEKYGKGTLNIESGEFTPTEEETPEENSKETSEEVTK